jgi:serine/threonine protein kinase/Tfp pilus assembly protein PilF
MPADPKLVRDLFLDAAELPSAGRVTYLTEHCGDDVELRAAVERLLAAHEQPASILIRPAPGMPTADYPPISEGPGTVIGPYKLLQRIGEGGFGVVFMAEQQQPIRRMVALKIIKPGMDTAQVIARFESERQALALMDHPNIAKVLDAGATGEPSGVCPRRPYFVMELVKGVPITEFCDKNHMPAEQRLKLFIDVCHAIQHAHHKGVIHRDIKPSNVMVTLHDGVPVVKAIDFGVAKATAQKLTERTLFTAYGQMVGTPAYMSPEQAEMSGLDIDTRSDVYSLGVLLYELLTGTTPLESKRLREAGYAEMQRLIREEEAPRPSTRLSSLGDSATVLAGNRGTDPKQLARLLAGDLDWIVMKAVDKDRNRRYGTPGNFAEDIERYLRREPLLARPPSTIYKLKKFAQRNRAAVLAVAAVAATLVVGTAVATWQAVRATRAEAQALAERDEKELARKDADAARHKAEDFADQLRQASALAGRAQLLAQAGRWSSAHDAFAKAEELQPSLITVYVYRAWMYEELGLWELAAADSVNVLRLSAGGGWSSGSWYQHALLRLHVGDENGCREACRRMLQRFGDPADNNLEWFTNSPMADANLVRACVLSAKPAPDVEELARRAEHAFSMSWPEHRQWTLYVAGLAHYRAGHYEQAVTRLRQALSGDANWIARAINYPPLAMAYHRLGEAGEARQALAAAEQAINGWTDAMDKGPVGTMPIPWFDWLECWLFYREAKQLLTGSLPTDDPRLRAVHQRALAAVSTGDASAFTNRGRAHAQRGEWDQAAAQFAHALDRLPTGLFCPPQRKLTPICTEMVPHSEVFARLIKLRPRDTRPWVARAGVWARKGEWDKAAGDLAKAVDIDPDVPENWYRLAMAHLGAGRPADYRRACVAMLERLGNSDDPYAQARIVYTCVYLPDAVPDPSAVVGAAERAVKRRWPIHVSGAALCRTRKFAAALPLLERAIEEGIVGCKPWEWLFAALAHENLGHHEQARHYLEQSRKWIKEADRREAEPGSELWFDPYQPVEVKQLYQEAAALIAGKPVKAKSP